MALTIDHPEADRLARELAEMTGESVDEAVLNALRHRLAHAEAARRDDEITRELRRLREEFRRLPPVDGPSDDDYLYDEHGLPH